MEKLAKLIAAKMAEYDVIPNNDDTIECYIYGMQLVLSAIMIFMTMVITSIFFGRLIECIVFALSFCPLRSLAGGYHCKKYSSCFILSMAFWFILVALLHLQIYYYTLALTILMAVLTICILIIAPIEHKNNPLSPIEMKAIKRYIVLMLLAEIICYCLLVKYKLYVFSFILTYSISVTFILMIVEKIGGDKNEENLLEVGSKTQQS